MCGELSEKLSRDTGLPNRVEMYTVTQGRLLHEADHGLNVVHVCG